MNTALLPPPTADAAARRRVLVSSTIGSAIEWYDFYLYSTAAALILGPLFLPSDDPVASTLAAFATYAVGFVARPLGGVIAGHLGDRVGRKAVLVATLLTMGVATTGIGLLPTHEQIGVWAPVLLVTLRVLQGIGIGGEWGGAVLLAHEYAPPGKKAFYASWPQVGYPLGLLAGTLAFSAASLLPEEQFLSWGWRIPFVASALLVAVGLVIRLRLDDTPEFEALRAARGTRSRPLQDALAKYPRRMAAGTLAALGHGIIVTVFTVYLLKEFSGPDGEHRSAALAGLMVAAALQCVVVPLAGRLADRVGPARVLLAGYLCGALALVPALTAAGDGSFVAITASFMLAMSVGHGLAYGAIAGYLASLFPAEVRYSAISTAYQVGSTVSAFGPLAAAALVPAAGGDWPVVLLVIGCLAAAALAVVSEMKQRGPTEVADAGADRPTERIGGRR